jgi:diguanylate cyclase
LPEIVGGAATLFYILLPHFTQQIGALSAKLAFLQLLEDTAVAQRSPTDLARDTLKLLATRRLAPTPTNYQAAYEEVAGLLPQVEFPQTPLRRIASALPSQTPVQKRLAQTFQQAVESKDWKALQSAITDYAQLDLGIMPINAVAAPAPAQAVIATLPESLAQQLSRMVQATMVVLGDEDQRMHALSDQLVSFLNTAPPPLATVEQMLHNYSYRLSFTSQDQAQRRHAIHALLRMVGQHIGHTAAHDLHLQAHAQALAQAMEQPWTLQQLDTIQTHLKNLLARHLLVESNRSDAHAQLKTLLAQHAQQLSSLGQHSDSHAQALQSCAAQIQQSQDLGDLAAVLEAVVQSGSALATENRIALAQLEDLREQNQRQEQAIETLGQTLSQVEDSTRHDPETGALNPTGLQEALQVEAARNRRHLQPTSLASLAIDPPAAPWGTAPDIDPEALATASRAHLARLVRSTLRPQDTLARTSVQQFALLFPDTDPGHAAQALSRLQTELKQQALTFNEANITLQVSAGVIAVHPLDTPADAIRRADQACEQAQRMGGARVALG